MPEGADLELQIVSSATPYLNLTQYGFINVHRRECVAADARTSCGVDPGMSSDQVAV